MKALPLAVGIALVLAGMARAAAGVTIADGDHEGLPQFKIVTPGATWYYDKAGGGFSRLIDRDGNDWIAFSREIMTGVPAAAASGFRGLPNAVFGKDNPDAGAGHPGKDKCESTLIAPDTIRTVSKSGAWAWTWRFTPTHAIFRMEKADPASRWWFLYEGPVGGRYAPRQQYWGTNLGGPRTEAPAHGGGKDVTGHWRWVYVGDNRVPRVLALAQAIADDHGDSFGYMGNTAAGLDAPNGMLVFGFGRAPRPQLQGAGQEFRVGFVEEAVRDPAGHARLARAIEGMLEQ